METFKNQEEDYQAWLQQNDTGYVLNHFASNDAKYNVMHLATCSYMHRPTDERRRTVVEKWCATSMAELEVEANSRLGADGWVKCSACCTSE